MNSMPTQIEQKLQKVEHDLDNLKAMVLKLSQQKTTNKTIKLEGALKGISVSEKDIQKAKKSLFSGA